MAKAKDNRTKNWTFILYPESCIENWQEVLTGTVSFLCSPLHDKDVNPDGTTKKAHWHVVCMFNSNKTYEQVAQISKELNGTIPESVRDIKPMTRYLVHADNPSKYQYDRKDIKLFGCPKIDLESMFLSKSDTKNIRREIFQYMIDNNITELADLIDYARENREDWFDNLIDSDFMLVKYIESARHRKPVKKQT